MAFSNKKKLCLDLLINVLTALLTKSFNPCVKNILHNHLYEKCFWNTWAWCTILIWDIREHASPTWVVDLLEMTIMKTMYTRRILIMLFVGLTTFQLTWPKHNPGPIKNRKEGNNTREGQEWLCNVSVADVVGGCSIASNRFL